MALARQRRHRRCKAATFFLYVQPCHLRNLNSSSPTWRFTHFASSASLRRPFLWLQSDSNFATTWDRFFCYSNSTLANWARLTFSNCPAAQDGSKLRVKFWVTLFWTGKDKGSGCGMSHDSEMYLKHLHQPIRKFWLYWINNLRFNLWVVKCIFTIS